MVMNPVFTAERQSSMDDFPTMDSATIELLDLERSLHSSQYATVDQYVSQSENFLASNKSSI